ncbi:MAG: hypothetical protein IH878_18855 [Gemmatimonadetes bacterium]|nr:hypothetical protein [Gemmatimonadota bacterium]
MPKVDQFESAFRAASKTVFEYQPIAVRSILVITDRSEAKADIFGKQISDFLSVLRSDDSPRWRIVNGSEFDTVPELLALVEAEQPDLICTYRHLHSESWRWPYTLGEYVDVLTQVTTTPVMVLPHPDAMRASEHAVKDTLAVMAMTDHLTGDAVLVNYAARFTEPSGKLFLTHIEDEATFERYMGTISRIPSIDTENSRRTILEQLLKEPKDYIRSCREVLEAEGLPLAVEEIVTKGHHLHEFEKLVEKHEVDLLVFNTKDEDQLAMHGLAYPLAVELRQIPLLML